MPGLRHELISASAGSGKTWQLVRRYLHLLALGEEPRSIVAMTFTRKAAGEFFNRILAGLARLASGKLDAAEYFAGLQPAPPPDVDYGALLRRLTRQTHRLRLGTLDSFFTSIAACFPLESGLPAAATVMDENEAALAQMETLDALLDMLHQNAGDPTAKLILDAVKQASFGSEQKSIEQILRGWVEDNHQLWNDSPGPAVWGDPKIIWPDWDLAADAAPSSEDIQAAAAALRDLFPPATPSGSQLLDSLVEEAPLTTPGAPPPKSVESFLKLTVKHFDALQNGDAAVTWGRRETAITGDTARAWTRLARLLCQREFLVRAHRTRFLARFLEAYEECYARRVRSHGRLAFADIPRLLGGSLAEDGGWSGEEICYRLDGRFDHWMLDEFQDTSHNQWRVTSRLVSEVLQDNGGRRSFFAVGDVKQSIYTWRQAEPKIFTGLQHRHAGAIHLGALAKSYRSAPAVLEAVNRVFADRAAIEELLPGSTEDWLFETHIASQEDMNGYAALLETAADEKDDDDGPDHSPVTRAVAALLRRLEPLRRGLTCAVLVRQNSHATDLSDALRALTGMNVVTESQVQPATDNAPVLALLSLLQLAAHPADTAALEHLRMTPLHPLIENNEHGAAVTALRVAGRVFERGFAAFALEWAARIRQARPDLDTFHQRRLAEFADLCAAFDETGSRDIDSFLQAARDHRLSHPSAPDAVQVMTIHKSKGLEFDIVILAGFGHQAMNQRRRSGWLVRRDDGRTEWVLQEPLKICAESDTVLREQERLARAGAGFESLCLLYVAMTRAKRGLYMATPPAPKNPSSIKADTFLRRRLGADSRGEDMDLDGEKIILSWQHGDPGWFDAFPLQPAAAAPPPVLESPAPLSESVRQNQPRQRRRTPSGEEAFHVPGKVLFAPGRDIGRNLGSRVHELLAEVEWWSAQDSAEPLIARWTQRGLLPENDPATSLALGLILPVLDDPACAPALAQPNPHAQVWREKPFDFIDEGGWVSGVFDRVVLDHDETGNIVSARVIDFKTDEAPDAAALEEKRLGYAPQLALYRRAVARLTGLPLESVSGHLLFLRPRRLVAV